MVGLAFSKVVFQVKIITIVPCFRCDLVMSSGERNSLKRRFSVIYNVSALAIQILMKISHKRRKTLQIPNMIIGKMPETPLTQTTFK